jgi:hypothetical protein
MTLEKRLVGTLETLLNNVPVAYSVLLRYEPPYTDEWEDEISGEMHSDRYGSECAVELVRHEVGQDPMECKSAWVEIDYNEDAFPHVLDIDSVEWVTLFDDAGREWTEFRECPSDYAARAHLISNLMKAVGL